MRKFFDKIFRKLGYVPIREIGSLKGKCTLLREKLAKYEKITD